MQVLSPAARDLSTRRFALYLAIAAAIAAVLPALIAILSAPVGSHYLGYVYNIDDHMVYAAWMRQAMDGHFLFDNRFTTDAQPGLTIHLYFLVLGFIARFTGIAFAANLGRFVFSLLFVCLGYQLIRRLSLDIYETKMALALAVIGGGVGFLNWHPFGVEWPIDVWQPEVFVFPSMLSNGLFMVSLCLILGILQCVLAARDSWKPVAPGAACMFVLMNIHSYDVLLVTFILIGFLVACAARHQASRTWIVRAVVIGLGAVPPALYFLMVLKNDAVFQARAATPTYSPNFEKVLLGLLMPLLIGLLGLWLRIKQDPEPRRRLIGLGLVTAMIIAMYLGAGSAGSGYFMTPEIWAISFIAGLTGLYFLADENPTVNLFLAWAVLGTIAIYFPALFQRKLAIGLAIPWSVLAAFGIGEMLKKQDRSARNLVGALVIILFGASSIRWAFREIQLAGANVSNTTMHSVFLTSNVQKILDYLNAKPGRKIVVALPGVQSATLSARGPDQVPPSEWAPAVPDLNPIVSGLTGAYTYAGHWSETPDYLRRRNELSTLFLGDLTDDQRLEALKKIGADYVLTPTPESFPGAPLFDFRKLGKVVVDGPRFRLIGVPSSGAGASLPESSPAP